MKELRVFGQRSAVYDRANLLKRLSGLAADFQHTVVYLVYFQTGTRMNPAGAKTGDGKSRSDFRMPARIALPDGSVNHSGVNGFASARDGFKVHVIPGDFAQHE